MAPKQGEDEFIRQCLVSGPNSFKRQNQLGFYEPGNPNQTANPDFMADNRFDPDHIRWLKAGWGLAAFSPEGAQTAGQNPSNPSIFLQKSGKATFEEPEHYTDTVEQVAQSHAPTLLGHLRESKLPGHKTETHPFRIGPWVFMHQGDLSNQITRELREKLAQYPTAPQPVSQTDSELLGCYITHRLAEQYGEPSQMSTQQLLQGFGGLLQELRQWPQNQTEADQHTARHRFRQGAEHPGMLNFILSDGKRIIASACTQNPESYLQLGTRHLKNGETEYLLSTFKMQPTSKQQKEPIHWQEVPNHSLVVLERQSDGHGKPFVGCRQIALDDLDDLNDDRDQTIGNKLGESATKTKTDEKAPVDAPKTEHHPTPTKIEKQTKPKPASGQANSAVCKENVLKPKAKQQTGWLHRLFYQPLQQFWRNVGKAWRWLLDCLGFNKTKRSKPN